MLSLAVALEVLLVDVVGKHPSRILHLGGNAKRTDRSLPVKSAETDREGINHFAHRARHRFRMMLVLVRLRYGGSRRRGIILRSRCRLGSGRWVGISRGFRSRLVRSLDNFGIDDFLESLGRRRL